MADLHSISFAAIGDQQLFSAISDFVGASLPPGDRQQETYVVDFKQEWGEKALRVVAGFANTFGGVIVIGVSENAGRADQIIGVPSNKEITTQIASSIASNITPTPDYDIAECSIPADPSKRLAVIRVRLRNRVHFLLKGDRPVYIRNQDQAIPAPAAELRALIERERFDTERGQFSVDPFSLPTLLMSELLGATTYDASDSSRELLFCAVRMTDKILARIVDGMLHQVVRLVSVSQVGPRAQQGVRPSRFRGGLQLLIGSNVARAPGPTPSQVFPVRFHRRFREHWPGGGFDHQYCHYRQLRIHFCWIKKFRGTAPKRLPECLI